MRNFIIILENALSEETAWQNSVKNRDWKNAFLYADTREEVVETLRVAGAKKIEFDFASHMPPVFVFDDYVIEWDGVSGDAKIEEKNDWMYSIDPDEYFPRKDTVFSNDFWSGPCELYHETSEDHVDDILEHGIECRNETRGLSNRGVGCAVFTTSNYEGLRGSYGDFVFKIDTEAMKNDGYTPFVKQEPPVVKAENREAIAHHIGLENPHNKARRLKKLNRPR